MSSEKPHLAPVPGWLLTLSGKPVAENGPKLGWVADILVALAGSDHRNIDLTAVAGKLRHGGLEAEEIEVILAPHGEACGLPLDELKKICQSVGKYPLGHGGEDGRRFLKSSGGRPGFVPKRLAEEVAKGAHICVGVDGRLYRYSDGVYRNDGETFVRVRCRELLAEEYRRNRVDEVVGWCRDHWPTFSVDRLPKALINFTNGLLDLRTGELLAHSPEVLTTIQIPIRYDPDAQCPEIDRFLSEVLPKDCLGQGEHPGFVDEVVGHLLVPDSSLRKAILLLGGGRNGKSTFLGIIRETIGPNNACAVSLQALAEDRFKPAELFGKLANLCGDLDPRAVRRSDTFKTIVGGTDTITAERKYGHPFSFVPFSRLIFSANEAPPSADQSEAWFDRWIVVPFPVRIPEDKVDPRILERLTVSSEIEGIVARAVKGLRQLEGRGRFELPRSVLEAGRGYRERLDSVVAFVNEETVVNPSAWVLKTKLYDNYSIWCSSNSRLSVSGTKFTERLVQDYPEQIEDTRQGGSGQRIYKGIGLLASEEDM